jgi:hypothetical protein
MSNFKAYHCVVTELSQWTVNPYFLLPPFCFVMPFYILRRDLKPTKMYNEED